MTPRLWLSIVLCTALLIPPCFADESLQQILTSTAGETAVSSKGNPEESIGEDEHGQDELQRVRELLRQLQRQIAEMNEQHAAEIKQLKREVEELRWVKPKTEDAEKDEL